MDRVQLRSVSGQEAQEVSHHPAPSRGGTPAPQAWAHGHPSWPFKPPVRRPPCCSCGRSKTYSREGGSESAVRVSHRGSWECPGAAWRERLDGKRRQSGRSSRDPGGRPGSVPGREGPEITSCPSPDPGVFSLEKRTCGRHHPVVSLSTVAGRLGLDREVTEATVHHWDRVLRLSGPLAVTMADSK